MERIVKNFLPERKPQPMLETIGFILGRIEFKLHTSYYVIHTYSNGGRKSRT